MAATILDEETIQKVIRQVDYYFSDSNLIKDTFLSQTIAESEDGMVSLALICGFARMRGHLGLGDVNPDDFPEETLKAVAQTLRTSEFLNISKDGEKVGRKAALLNPEEVIEQLDNRTIAASPLPFDVKLEDIESLFAQFGKVCSVRLPRHVANKNLLCGTALVEFSSEEDVENILKKTVEFAGVNLELHPKKDFDAERKKQEQELANAQSNTNGKGSEEPSYAKGLIIAFTLKSKSSGDNKQNGAEKPGSKVDGSKTDEGDVDKTTESDKNGVEKMVEGNNDNVDQETPESDGKEVKDGEESKNGSEKPAIDISREDLKPAFEKYGTVKFIDFQIGRDSGYIRFEEAEAAQKACASAVLTDEGGLSVKSYIAILEPVTDEAEKEYWNQIRGSRFNGNGYRGRGGRHRRGGRFGRSRDRDSSPAGRSNKVQKVGLQE